MRWAAAVLTFALAFGSPVWAAPEAESEASTSDSEQRIRELWAELQRLMASLPESRRAELWHELESGDLAEPDGQELAELPPPEPDSEELAELPPPEPLESAPVEALDSDSSDDDPSGQAGRRGCNTLTPFDSDGDLKLTGLDRYWRHFYLWFDHDDNGVMAEGELEPPFEKGVRQISLNLRSFVRGKKKKARELQILDEQYLLLDLDGDGWQGTVPSSKDGALAVDVDALKRSGGPALMGPDGSPLTGIQAFRPSWSYSMPGQEPVEMRCPRR